METNYDFDTVSEAIEAFRKKGFTLDFNLEENCISCATGKFDADEFNVVGMYHYEGDSDPADQAVVYAIESDKGHKGILVTGYGVSEDTVSTRILKKLSMK